MRKKVLLLDADLGLANVDVMLGLKPIKTLYDFLEGNCQLKDVCLQGPHGLKVIPSSTGIQKMADLTSAESVGLIHSFSSLVEDIDVMLVDMASGISNQVIDFTNASKDILIVICNNPASFMDSYAVIKILHQKYGRKRFGIIVNKVKNQGEGQSVFSKFQETVNNFFKVNLHYLGHVPEDDYIGISARERNSFVDLYPQSKASFSLNNICKMINCWQEEDILPGGIQFFFEKLVQAE